jgi:hypothetical protein
LRLATGRDHRYLLTGACITHRDQPCIIHMAIITDTLITGAIITAIIVITVITAITVIKEGRGIIRPKA